MFFRIVIVAIAISIGVRLLFIGRPLSVHFEWLTAHTLMTYDIWSEEGMLTHHGLPVYTYPSPTSKNIMIGDLGSCEKDGIYYYISYPALGFILPYILTIGYAKHLVILQLFNVLLHLIGFYFLYKLLRLFFAKAPSLWACLLYLFDPSVMWYHGNVYFVDSLAQCLFIIVLFFSVRYEFFKRKADQWFSWIFLTALCQTEWIGYLVAFTMFIWALYHKKLHEAIAFVFLVSLNISITFLHFGHFLGYEAYLEAILHKFWFRIGTEEAKSHFWGEWKPFLLFVLHYLVYHFPMWLMLLLNVWALLPFLGQSNLLKPTSQAEKYVLLLAFAPVLLHHLLLYNFTTGHYDFPTIKGTICLCILCGFSYDRINKYWTSSQSKYFASFISWLIILLGVLFFIIRNDSNLSFYIRKQWVLNPYMIDTEFQELGERIRKNAQTDEVVGLVSSFFSVNSQIQYYAKRNILYFENIHQAHEFAQKYQRKLLVYFVGEDFQVQDSVYITPKIAQ